jgi:hypothetical protein
MIVGRGRHLARRFVGALRARPLATDEAAWVSGHLLDGEAALWSRMSVADQRHAFGVASSVDAALDGADRPVLAAALLHDVGKVASGLGTWSRVGATLVGAVTSSARHARWAGRPGALGRLGRYLRHPAEGAALLAEAGSDPLTVAWAAEHHRRSSSWTVAPEIARALWAADDD